MHPWIFALALLDSAPIVAAALVIALLLLLARRQLSKHRRVRAVGMFTALAVAAIAYQQALRADWGVPTDDMPSLAAAFAAATPAERKEMCRILLERDRQVGSLQPDLPFAPNGESVPRGRRILRYLDSGGIVQAPAAAPRSDRHGPGP